MLVSKYINSWMIFHCAKLGSICQIFFIILAWTRSCSYVTPSVVYAIPAQSLPGNSTNAELIGLKHKSVSKTEKQLVLFKLHAKVIVW